MYSSTLVSMETGVCTAYVVTNMMSILVLSVESN